MTLTELHSKLKDAYAVQNLNKITVTLIRLYKDEQFGTLRKIAEMISESVDFSANSDARYFSKMMMLYHPDRGDFHRSEIERLASSGNYDGLLGYSHILMLGKIEEIAATLSDYEDIDYSPVYEWDINLDDFTIINTKSDILTENAVHFAAAPAEYSFYEGVQMRMYGDITTGFPTYYLEDLDEFELSQSGINDLDGIQYCKHAVVMDLSDNAINDISLLWDLSSIEELNLSDNRIEDIDALANLRNLKTVNLANNCISDVSYLLHLPNLEMVNLTGTRVPQSQVEELEEAGITVII
jgi:Leucine-rich repeat (LRR) protein